MDLWGLNGKKVQVRRGMVSQDGDSFGQEECVFYPYFTFLFFSLTFIFIFVERVSMEVVCVQGILYVAV